MEEKIILLFQTTHETLSAEKMLKENGIYAKPRIKPRKIASKCGIGLEIGEDTVSGIMALCKRNNFSMPGIFKVSDKKVWVAFAPESP